MTELVLAATLLGGFALAYLAGRLHEALLGIERDRHLPYRLRDGLDDLSAVNTDTTVRLAMIREQLALIEARAQVHHELMGQIRNGKYEKEQPASPRRVKGNGSQR